MLPIVFIAFLLSISSGRPTPDEGGDEKNDKGRKWESESSGSHSGSGSSDTNSGSSSSGFGSSSFRASLAIATVTPSQPFQPIKESSPATVSSPQTFAESPITQQRPSTIIQTSSSGSSASAISNPHASLTSSSSSTQSSSLSSTGTDSTGEVASTSRTTISDNRISSSNTNPPNDTKPIIPENSGDFNSLVTSTEGPGKENSSSAAINLPAAIGGSLGVLALVASVLLGVYLSKRKEALTRESKNETKHDSLLFNAMLKSGSTPVPTIIIQQQKTSRSAPSFEPKIKGILKNPGSMHSSVPIPQLAHLSRQSMCTVSFTSDTPSTLTGLIDQCRLSSREYSAEANMKTNSIYSNACSDTSRFTTIGDDVINACLKEMSE